jgi:hypothetical protein
MGISTRKFLAVIALSALANAGADVRTTSAFAIHHDKVLCVDKMHVETGGLYCKC